MSAWEARCGPLLARMAYLKITLLVKKYGAAKPQTFLPIFTVKCMNLYSADTDLSLLSGRRDTEMGQICSVPKTCIERALKEILQWIFVILLEDRAVLSLRFYVVPGLLPNRAMGAICERSAIRHVEPVHLSLKRAFFISFSNHICSQISF